MNDIALVTANFGGIDEPRALPAHDGIDAFYYTDQAVAPEVAQTWTAVVTPNYPRYDFGPRLRAKYFKTQIHRLDEVRHHRWLAWADGSLRFDELGFFVERARALERLPAKQRLLFIPHPDRPTVLSEFEFVERLIAEGHPGMTVRYVHEKMPEQMDYFRARGWNLEAKLWCGTIWMVENSDRVRRLLDDWWDQSLRFGIMDQLPLPVLFDHHRLEPQALEINLWNNHYFRCVGHQRRM